MVKPENPVDLKGFTVRAVALIVVLAGGSAFVGTHLPVGVAVGGVLAMVNLWGIASGLSDILSSENAARKIIFSSVVRLTILSVIIVALAVLRLVDLVGLLAGFAGVSLLVLAEGLRWARRASAVSDAPAGEPGSGN